VELSLHHASKSEKNNEKIKKETSLKSMIQMKDGLEAIQKEVAAYIEKYDEDGVHIEVQGDVIVKNLKFASGTPSNIAERAINCPNTQI
jgi:hypothetical protein